MQKMYFLVLFCFGITCYSYSQCPLVCNDQINVSLEESCEALVTVDMVYEGYIDPNCNYRVEIEGQSTPLLTGPGEYVYRIYDDTGNFCWGNILAEDKLDPMASCTCETPYLPNGQENPDCVFFCHEVWDLEILEADGPNNFFNQVLPPVSDNMPNDNCGVSSNPSTFIDVISAPNCDDKIVKRTIVYSYSGSYNGGSVTCVQQFLFKSLDVFNSGTTSNGQWVGDHDFYCPEPLVELTCGADVSPAGIAAFLDVNNSNAPDYSQTPNIEENNEGIPYAYPYVIIKGWDGQYHAKPIINSLCNINTGFTDVDIDACGFGCSGNRKIVRDWTVIDWCTSSVIHCEQIIKAADSDGPTISAGNLNVSVDPWECSATVIFPGPSHLYDDCDNAITYHITGPPGVLFDGNVATKVPKGIHTFEYVATDCCGNSSSTPVTVTVSDNTPPVAIATQNIVVNLTSGFDGVSVAKLFAFNVDNFSYDGCSDEVLVQIRRDDDSNDCDNIGLDGHNNNSTYSNEEGPNSLNHPNDDRDDTDNGEFVKFCCEDIDPDNIDPNTGFAYGIVKVWLRVWDDGDMDGNFATAGDNYNETWISVRVEDKLGPSISCPPDVRIDCDESYSNIAQTGTPTISTSCVGTEACTTDPVDVFRDKPANSQPYQGEFIPAFNQSCGYGAIERTWNCGPNSCRQWIIIDPIDLDETEIIWPRDTTIFCATTPVVEPIITEQQCQSLGVSMDSDTFYFEENACFKVLNHWSVIDWCVYDVNDPSSGGIYNYTQVIKFLDDEVPVISTQDTCYAVNANCRNDMIQLKASASDNGFCGSPWLKWEVEVDAWSDWTIDYTFTSYTDSEDNNFILPTQGQDGESVCITLPAGQFEGSCNVQHRVSWLVNDGCGNSASGTSFFTVEDKKKPTPYCVNLSTALMENGNGVELWACDFDAGSFDNCTDSEDLRFTFSPIAPEDDPSFSSADNCSFKTFGCSELAFAIENGGVYPVEVYVWDECGNSDFCIVNLTIVDNSGDCGLSGSRLVSNVSGLIRTETGIPLHNVQVDLSSDEPGYNATQTTTEDGSFMFANNPMYHEYMITPESNGDWLNGVSTLDLVLIQKHILTVEDLNSPYKYVAADANNDGKISSIDLIVLRKLILGLETELDSNTSWRFVPTNIDMEAANPFDFAEYRMILDLDQDMLEENFIAVKTGDVNDNAEANINGNSIDSRSDKTLKLNYNKRSENENTFFDFYSTNFKGISGMQFTLDIKDADIVGLQAGSLSISEDSYGVFDDILTVSWNSSEPAYISASEALFSVQVGNSNFDTPVSISDAITTSEAYQGESLDVLGVQLVEDVTNTLTLLQNEPNPWSDNTNISFVLPSDQSVQFAVFNIEGKQIYSTTSQYKQGVNEILLDRNQLQGTDQIFLYTITTETESITKKMIKID